MTILSIGSLLGSFLLTSPLMAVPRMAKSDLEISLTWVDIECYTLEGGVLCRLPNTLERRLEKESPRELLAPMTDPKALFVASAAMLAKGRFSELEPTDRARFVLEVHRRYPEVQPGTSFTVVFGDRGWWESESLPRRLTAFAHSLDRTVIPVIREVLAGEPAGSSLVNFALLLGQEIPGPLDPDLRGDLERVVESAPDSHAASLAKNLLDSAD